MVDRWARGGLCMALTMSGAMSAALAQEVVDVRLTGERQTQTVLAIARVGQSEKVLVQKDQTFESIVQTKCGVVHPAYVQAFASLNGLTNGAAVANLTADATYEFPACAQAPLAESIPIAPKQKSLKSILEKAGAVGIDVSKLDGFQPIGALPSLNTEVDYEAVLKSEGRSGQMALENFVGRANAQMLAVLNPDLSPRNMTPGEALVIPGQAPTWTSISLKAGVSADEAKTQIEEAIKADKGKAEVTEVVTANLISGVGGYGVGYCPGPHPSWPYSIDTLLDVRRANDSARPDGVYPRPVKILILDTGFDGAIMTQDSIPRDRIADVLGPVPPNPFRTKLGVNLADNQMTAMPPPGLANRLHGSEVAVMALGGRHALKSRELGGIPIQVAFASVATQTPNLNARAIGKAIGFAKRNDIAVINVSLMATAELAEFETYLKTGEDVLMVAAAGNDRQEFGGTTPTWPGGNGGALSHAQGGNVITVGSHDQSGAISPFSRFGGEYVDLLAPGCLMPTFTAGAEGGPAVDVEREGTSFSAPLVSNIAAQLISEGVEVAFVKNRILASVDVDAELEDVVYSRGRLNLRKALSVWRDVVEYHEGAEDGPVEIKTGFVLRPGKILKPCTSDVEVGRLMKLSFTQRGGEPKKAHVWLRPEPSHDPGRMTRKALCTAQNLAGQKITLIEDGTRSRIDIPLSHLIDFVPAFLGP